MGRLEYGGSSRHVIKNNKNKTIKYKSDIDKKTTIRKEQLFHETKKLVVNKEAEND